MNEAYQEHVDAVSQQHKTNIQSGLSSDEALQRLKKYGQNIIPKKGATSSFVILFHQFVSPIMFILAVAAGASILIGEFGDAIVIGIAVFINVIVGFIQEWKAEKAAAALQVFEVPECNVRRDGHVCTIKTSELVVGDIVILSAGSRIPADVRLSQVASFEVEEALLTGESQPIKKSVDQLSGKLVLGDRTNMAFRGTFVLNGRAEGIVVAIGRETAIGDIAGLVDEIGEDITPIQHQLKRFSWILGGVMLIIVVVILGIGFLRGFVFKELFATSIALAVAAVPGGLLVGMTVILAIGMQRMLKHKALVRKLISAETLGGVSVICTDKTGTLTEGKLSVVRVVTFNHDVARGEHVPDEVYDALVMVALNNDAHVSKDGKVRMGEPTELALLEGAIDARVDVWGKKEKFPRIDEIPFSSERKFMVTLHGGQQGQRLIVKGAPEVILSMCSLEPEKKAAIEKRAHEMTTEGLRVLALAFKDGQAFDLKSDVKELTFAALIACSDPLRETARQTVEQLKGAGIRTVLVTGDHAETARTIARGAGIMVRDNGLITGTQLQEMSEDELLGRISEIDVFARVDPRDKVRIVEAWKNAGQTVAMTGDGVNDAPALRSADIGIALGAGSDFVHEIADLVLLDNNLSTISIAVREGRIVFDNIRKVITYLLADSFSEVILIGGAVLMGLPLPLLAVQVLWINLVSDGPPSIALTMEPGEAGIMHEKPRKKDEPILNTEMKTIIFIIGIVTDLGLFGLYLILRHFDTNMIHLRTIIFTALSVDSLLFAYSIRSMRTSLFRMNPFSNKWMLPAIIIGLCIQLSVVYIPFLQKLFSTIPLGLMDWVIIMGLALVKITAIELTKEWFIIRRKKVAA